MTTPNTPDQRIDDLLDKFSGLLLGRWLPLPGEEGMVYPMRLQAEFKAALRAIVDEMMGEVIDRPLDYHSKESRLYFQANSDPIKSHRNGFRLGTRETIGRQRQRIPQILDKYFGAGK